MLLPVKLQGSILKKIKEKRYDINNIKKRGRFIMF